MKVVFLFLDGVGLGQEDPDVNPFFRAKLPVFRSLLNGEMMSLRNYSHNGEICRLLPLDACLGVKGLPQSGTGQASIFTGINAAALLGKHFGPHPTVELRELLQQKNLIRSLREKGFNTLFVNAFPGLFFNYARKNPNRLSVTTIMHLQMGISLQDADALRRSEALSADLTRDRWVELGYPDITPIPVAETGRHLASLTEKLDFLLLDYWLPDHAGHARNMEEAIAVLEKLDSFLGVFLGQVDLTSTLVIISSDHGNIEDLSVKTHTLNPVPCMLVGKKGAFLADGMTSICELSPLIERAMIL